MNRAGNSIDGATAQRSHLGVADFQHGLAAVTGRIDQVLLVGVIAQIGGAVLVVVAAVHRQ
jgi:hypothetical protein